MVPLSCEWNWQLGVAWYAHAKWILPRNFFKVRSLRVNKHDSSCHVPPKVPLFNTEKWKRARTKLMLGQKGPAALAHNTAVIRKALAVQNMGILADCVAAAATLPSVAERACNATFLLQRHTSFVKALWRDARDQKLLVWSQDV